jgi:hypothetical protein
MLVLLCYATVFKNECRFSFLYSLGLDLNYHRNTEKSKIRNKISEKAVSKVTHNSAFGVSLGVLEGATKADLVRLQRGTSVFLAT